MFGPLIDVVGKGNMQQAFDDARNTTLNVLQIIGDGIIDLGRNMLTVANGVIDVVNSIRYLTTVTTDPGSGVVGAINKLRLVMQLHLETMLDMFGLLGVIPENQRALNLAKQWKDDWQNNANQNVPLVKFNLGGQGLKKQLGEIIDGARNAPGVMNAANGFDNEAARMVENFDQAKGALEQFGQSFKNAMGDPLTAAIENLARFDQLIQEAENQGVGLKADLLAANPNVVVGLMKPVLDFANQQAQVLQQARTNSVNTVGSAALVESIGKAQIGGQVTADVQTRIAQSLELQKGINEQTRDASIQAAGFLRQIANQPKGNPIGKI
jgi:hypothetical protein